MPTFTPALDPAIARKYDVKSLEGKMQNKAALQEELGWPEERRCALLCLPAGMTDALGGELLKELLPGLLTLKVNIVILGKGSADFGTLFTELANEHPHRIAIIPNKEEMIRRMYAGCDMALFCADASDQPELQHSLRYGVVPITLTNDRLEDYNPNQESGTAFIYNELTPWHAFAALVRALETFRFPFDWKTIQKHCMESIS